MSGTRDDLDGFISPTSPRMQSGIRKALKVSRRIAPLRWVQPPGALCAWPVVEHSDVGAVAMGMVQVSLVAPPPGWPNSLQVPCGDVLPYLCAESQQLRNGKCLVRSSAGVSVPLAVEPDSISEDLRRQLLIACHKADAYMNGTQPVPRCVLDTPSPQVMWADLPGAPCAWPCLWLLQPGTQSMNRLQVAPLAAPEDAAWAVCTELPRPGAACWWCGPCQASLESGAHLREDYKPECVVLDSADAVCLAHAVGVGHTASEALRNVEDLELALLPNQVLEALVALCGPPAARISRVDDDTVFSRAHMRMMRRLVQLACHPDNLNHVVAWLEPESSGSPAAAANAVAPVAGTKRTREAGAPAAQQLLQGLHELVQLRDEQEPALAEATLLENGCMLCAEPSSAQPGAGSDTDALPREEANSPRGAGSRAQAPGPRTSGRRTATMFQVPVEASSEDDDDGYYDDADDDDGPAKDARRSPRLANAMEDSGSASLASMLAEPPSSASMRITGPNNGVTPIHAAMGLPRVLEWRNMQIQYLGPTGAPKRVQPMRRVSGSVWRARIMVRKGERPGGPARELLADAIEDGDIMWIRLRWDGEAPLQLHSLPSLNKRIARCIEHRIAELASGAPVLPPPRSPRSARKGSATSAEAEVGGPHDSHSPPSQRPAGPTVHTDLGGYVFHDPSMLNPVPGAMSPSGMPFHGFGGMHSWLPSPLVQGMSPMAPGPGTSQLPWPNGMAASPVANASNFPYASLMQARLPALPHASSGMLPPLPGMPPHYAHSMGAPSEPSRQFPRT